MIDSLQYISDSAAILDATVQHLIDSVHYSQTSIDQIATPDEGTSLATIVSIITVIVIFGSFFGYNAFNNRYWEKGIFPPMLRNRSINHFEAIVCLSVNIIRCNKEGYTEKQGVLVKYIRRYFPEHCDGVVDSMKGALQTPISTDSIAYWMNKHIKTIDEKLQILDLLFAIAVVDGHVLKKESIIVEQFCSKMGIPIQEYTKRWEVHNRTREERDKSEHSQSNRRNNETSDELKIRFLSLFDLPINSSKEVIKKVYRKLVKENHPDMFKDADLVEKQAISERFIKIQEAYDYLMDLP